MPITFKCKTGEAYHIKILAEYDFINGDTTTYNESGQDSVGQDLHGTNTLSIIGGYMSGQLIGPAYGSEFLLGKTEFEPTETPIEEDYWVAGIEWFEANGVDVVSSSVGYMDWYDYSDMNGETAVTTIAAEIAVTKLATFIALRGSCSVVPAQWGVT